MLEDMATTGHESIVSWQPHGMSFRVHLPEVFTSTVMPRYFPKQTKYKSFLRQLHIYGFQRICKGRDRGAYFHGMFIRSKKSRSFQMTRQKLKGKNSRTPGDHPDFYPLVKTVKLENDQSQDRRSLTGGPQSDPRMPQASTTTEEVNLLRCPSTVYTDTGNVDHQPDDEEKLSHLVMRAFLFNQESAGAVVPSPATHQRSCGEDSIDDAVDWLGLMMQGGNENNLDGDEGIFFGKRFFDVAESEIYR
jgi:hypothetical protein